MNKEFPKHWGHPPAIQTGDIRKLPGNYGDGSSTTAGWIKAKMEKDLLNKGGLNSQVGMEEVFNLLKKYISSKVSLEIETHYLNHHDPFEGDGFTTYRERNLEKEAWDNLIQKVKEI